MPCPDGVDTFTLGLHHQTVTQLFCDAVDTSYGGHNPYLITNTHIPVLPNISLKGSLLVFDSKRLVNRIICVFKCSAEVGLEVILVYPISSFHVLTSMTDRITVFDNILSLFHFFNKNFVTSRSILIHGDLFAVNLDDFTLLLGLQTNHDGVGGIDF